MSRPLPPIFVLVAAFLVNLSLNPIVTLECEKIGLLKTSNLAVAGRYISWWSPLR